MAQPTLIRNEHPSAAQMVVGDTYITYRLLKQGLRRVAGGPVSPVTAFIALGVLEGLLRRLAAPTVKKVADAGNPTVGDTMLVGALLREGPRSIAGTARGREIPFAGTIITATLAGLALHLFAEPARRLRAGLAALGRILW